MSKHRVLISDQVDIKQLQLGEDFAVDYKPGLSREDLLKLVGDYEVLIVRSRTKVDREVLERASRLKAIGRPGTGLDNIDTETAKVRGVAVLNSPESLVEAVSEHVILLMLALSRNLVVADSSVKAGKWIKEGLTGIELKGKTLGIVGLGKIGRRVGEVAKAIGMSITGYDVIEIPQEVLKKMDCELSDLDALFSSADFVTLHVPLTAETKHLLDARRISLMKKGSFIVNTSRGGVIDEAGLVAALKEGKIAGAALDVFENEPPEGEILSAPNVILTPHVGGQTAEAQRSAITIVGDKVAELYRPRR